MCIIPVIFSIYYGEYGDNLLWSSDGWSQKEGVATPSCYMTPYSCDIQLLYYKPYNVTIMTNRNLLRIANQER